MELELQGVNKRYGETRAMDDVSFKLASGRILALLGPSGCGKTTTLKVIAGLIPPDSGKVLFDGQDVTELSPADRNIGMVFQNLALFPNLTAEENVAFPLEAREESVSSVESRVRDAIRMVELEGLQRRYPHQLSGGQQQRVAIARAISADAHLLLLDEPLASLDPNLKTEISDVIGKVQRELGVTTVYVTHDQIEAVLMSDFLAIMFEGKLDAIGRTQDLHESPPTERSASFLGATNVMKCFVERVTVNRILISVDGKEAKVVRPKWWDPRYGKARLLFRPEGARVVKPNSGLTRGTLVSTMYAGLNLIAKVQTAHGQIECRGNSSKSYHALSDRVGREVGVRVDLGRAIVF